MKNLLNLDSPLMIFMSRLTDIILLNAICILCSLPIITMGASMTALHYVTLKMVKREEGYLLKDFFKSFKENLKQSTIIWMIFLAITVLFFIDIKIVTSEEVNLPKILSIALCTIYFFVLITMIYVFPILARFGNTIKGTIRNAFLMSVLHIFKTVFMVIFYAIPIILIPLNYNFIAIYLLIGISTPVFINSYLFASIFRRYEAEA